MTPSPCLEQDARGVCRDPGCAPCLGALHAYAADLQAELYTTVAKFAVPLIANGGVFFVSEGRLTVYGLCNSRVGVDWEA
jgi:hypothetical protein